MGLAETRAEADRPRTAKRERVDADVNFMTKVGRWRRSMLKDWGSSSMGKLFFISARCP